MTASVSCLWAPDIARADIISGRSIRSPHFQDTALLTNYLIAFGGQAVPFHAIDVDINATESRDLRYMMRRRLSCRWRVWVIEVASLDATAVAEITLNGDSSTTVIVSIPQNTDGNLRRVTIVEDTTTQADTVEESYATVYCTQNGVGIRGCGVYELPRGILAEDSTDLGTQAGPFNSARPIVGSDVANIMAALKSRGTAPRNGLFGWQGEITRSTNTYADAFTSDFFAIPPLIGRGDTTNALLRLYVYGNAGASGTLDFRLTTDSGSYTGSISSSTPAWSSAVNVTQDCDDPTEADGIQSGSTGLCQLEWKRNGTGTAKMLGVSLIQDP